MAASPELSPPSAVGTGRPSRVELGDWQTPAALAEAVMALVARLEPDAQSVLEPTCGRGAFLCAAREVFPAARLLGYELSAEHAAHARRTLGGSNGAVHVGDFFETRWDEVLAELPEPLVVVGNPPWVTSSTLGALSGKNAPKKSNFKGHSGMDALTGKSNFDISEWMLRRLLEAAQGRRFTLAMLCKASVARRLLEHAHAERWALVGSVRPIDARTHFAAAVSAVLLVLRGPASPAEADGELAWDVFPSFGAASPASRMGVSGGRTVGDLEAYRRTEALEQGGPSGWRSGLKHDLARVMELTRRDGALFNGLGEAVSIEPSELYPLLKGSDLARVEGARERSVIVTQARLGEDTSGLAARAPATWRYLERHRAAFDARKSRIYRGQPPFAMFGVGDYSFAPYKVAISGLHKRLTFRVVGPREGKPVMLDDTSYFLPCADARAAERAAGLLRSEAAREFFEARVFWDDMRPINKRLLDALSLDALERQLGEDVTAG